MSMLPQLCDLGPTNLEKKFPDHRFSVEVTDRMFSRLQTSKQRYHSSYKGKDKKNKNSQSEKIGETITREGRIIMQRWWRNFPQMSTRLR